MVKLGTRTTAVLVIATLLLSLLPQVSSADSVNWTKIDAALRTLMVQRPQDTWGIIVESTTPTAAHADRRSNADRAERALARIKASKARGKAKLGIIGAASGSADYSAIAALSRDPFVARIHYDAPVRQAETTSTANVYGQVVRASEVWKLGLTGQGIGVAVLDSGVSGNPDLTLPTNRIAARVDLVGDSALAADPGGHGSHVAGIIAGNGFSAPPGSTMAYQGIAPGAQIIDVRVIGAHGATNLSNVIAGVQWVVQNRKTYNIRVMNLSLGAAVGSDYSYRGDPLVAALDVAWLSGITVFTAAGNSGPGAGSVESPGTSPLAITVGALDDAGTVDRSDDSVPSWSSRGPTPDRIVKPDLVAPGRRIISLFEAGSYLATQLPDRLVDTGAATYFRLSGTSMAAPVAAGVAALLLEKNPNLLPDQIKNILVSTARSVGGYDANSVGAGALDAYAAITSSLTTKANRGKRPSDGFARAILPLVKGQPLAWRDLSYAGRNWAGITWDNILWDGITWDNILWDGIMWDGIMWDGIMWDNITWDATWSTLNADSYSGQSSNFD